MINIQNATTGELKKPHVCVSVDFGATDVCVSDQLESEELMAAGPYASVRYFEPICEEGGDGGGKCVAVFDVCVPVKMPPKTACKVTITIAGNVMSQTGDGDLPAMHNTTDEDEVYWQVSLGLGMSRTYMAVCTYRGTDVLLPKMHWHSGKNAFEIQNSISGCKILTRTTAFATAARW